MEVRPFQLGQEIHLLDVYPKSKRPIEDRSQTVTISDRLIARQFGLEYFDGTRNQGYGGYNYHPRFWQPVVKRMQEYYGLTAESKILDVGCARGFLMHDFKELIPGITVIGIDLSKYAIDNALEDVKPFIHLGNAKEIPYADNSFDLVLSLNTIHNLPLEDCHQALREIERVSCKNKFIVNDAYRTEEERQEFLKWNLTALTILSTEQWKELFKLAGYTGDFYWFTP